MFVRFQTYPKEIVKWGDRTPSEHLWQLLLQKPLLLDFGNIQSFFEIKRNRSTDIKLNFQKQLKQGNKNKNNTRTR